MPPGKEGKIELAVEHTDGFAGEIAKSASVSSNDPKNPTFNLILRARFISEAPPKANPAAPAPPVNRNVVFTVEPADRWISSVLSGSSASSTLYLYNNSPTPVHIKRVIPPGNDFTADLQPIQDGKRYQLTLTSNPALKPGHYLQTLKVVTDSPVEPEVPIELDLTVYPKVFASPTSIVMPTLPAAADLSAINWPMIYVRKLRAEGLKIKGYSSTLPFIKLELLPETEGQVYKIRLTLDSSKIRPGEFKGKVRIETNDPEVPLLEVPIQGSFK